MAERLGENNEVVEEIVPQETECAILARGVHSLLKLACMFMDRGQKTWLIGAICALNRFEDYNCAQIQEAIEKTSIIEERQLLKIMDCISGDDSRRELVNIFLEKGLK